jgi:hypothetical protein
VIQIYLNVHIIDVKYLVARRWSKCIVIGTDIPTNVFDTTSESPEYGNSTQQQQQQGMRIQENILLST